MIPQNPLEDPELSRWSAFFLRRKERYIHEVERIYNQFGTLREYANLHLRFGIHPAIDATGQVCWRLREFMPNAGKVWLATERNGFHPQDAYAYTCKPNGIWELFLPHEALQHGDFYELHVQGKAPYAPIERRIPAFARYVVQDKDTPEQWCARFWYPDTPYTFQHDHTEREKRFPRIYEAHVGMAQPSERHRSGSVGTYRDFADEILPRIHKAGYTMIQLMAIPEHPLYKSFGYQVGNFFAPSSRYGTPDDFAYLVDSAHRLGLSVLVDLTHSHACANTEQGLARYDTENLFFTDQDNQWGTPTFNYQQEFVRRFLLSNCRYWLETFHLDGFRFDAVGNMLYTDFGRNDTFQTTESYFRLPGGAHRTNEAGELYLSLANALLRECMPECITIAEEFSGMPGLTCSMDDGGLGFSYRFAMGVPDFWSKCIAEGRDMGSMWYEMTNHRSYDRTISYVECHDQCINGDDAMIWRLLGKSMYTSMRRDTVTWNVSRGVAFYKLMRCLTLATADAGFLNFMGSEFGHPEWLDDALYAHRQWHLTDDNELLYAALGRWDCILLHTLPDNDFLSSTPLFFRYIHEENRILAFERGAWLFVFNFHELQPQANLVLQVTPGKYVETLSSDEVRFGGYDNLAAAIPATEHFSSRLEDNYLQEIHVYLPPMTALILHRE